MRPRGLTQADIEKIANFDWDDSEDEENYEDDQEGAVNFEIIIIIFYNNNNNFGTNTRNRARPRTFYKRVNQNRLRWTYDYCGLRTTTLFHDILILP